LRIDWSQHAPTERGEVFELPITRSDYIVGRVLSRLNNLSRQEA
jgi:hypothetical protein